MPSSPAAIVPLLVTFPAASPMPTPPVLVLVIVPVDRLVMPPGPATTIASWLLLEIRPEFRTVPPAARLMPKPLPPVSLTVPRLVTAQAVPDAP